MIMKLLPIGLAIVSGFFPFFAGAEVGVKAPDFILKDTTGKTHSLQDYGDKIIVLEWYNPGCPFVKKHYESGNMQSLQSNYTSKGVVWLSIVSSAKGKQGNLDPEEHNRIRKDWYANEIPLLVDEDGKVGRLYSAKTTPHIFILARDGKLAYEGAIDDHASTNPKDIKDSKNYVSEALNEILSGKSVSTPETESYGCSVKYGS
ncbi:MAG: thioredoxin family protein [SAR324 cluster bacterium]|uniref:Thioredoxin family protein n=1 Tax=SAR324 cluster bacterium TaxID=2024889 RepID=A0A7X9FQU0_9DELT|nr:thioredoxin family protein [SAR324 cluster bacterium]